MLSYLMKFCVIILVALPFYLLCRRPWKRVQVRKQDLRREVVVACFVLFHVGLLVLVLRGEYGNPVHMARRAAERIATGEGINLVPFRTIRGFGSRMDTDIFMVNIVGNIVMFMPWGFGVVLLWKKMRHAAWVIVYSLALPLLIETSQLFIGRSVDVDDLILNFAGSCLGAVVYFTVGKRFFKIY